VPTRTPIVSMPKGVDIYPPEADFECVETKIAPQFVFAIIHSKLQNARTFIRKNIEFKDST
jgi:hypothetical protein